MIVYDSQDRITLFSLYLDSGDKVVVSTVYKDDQVVSNICTTYDKDGNVISKNDLSVYEQQAVASASVTANSSTLETESLDGGMMLMMVPTAPQATSEEFTYDHLGNRYQYLDKEGYTTTITHNAVNQYEHLQRPLVFGLEDNVYPAYEANGNLEEDGLGYIYRYDYRNRLIRVEDYQSNVIAQYTYDALGRRIRKIAESKTTYFYYDTSNEVIAEYEGAVSPKVKREFVYGNGLDEVLAMFLPEYEGSEEDFQQFLDFCAAWMSDPNDSNWDNSLDVVDNDRIDLADFAYFAGVWSIPSNTESHYYYLHDAMGSVRGLIGGKYNRQEDREFYNYDVYEKPSETSTAGNPFLFAAYYHDTETGLYYLRARHYDPFTGRFIQFDPIGYADSMSLYEYALSSPMMFVDPWGFAAGKNQYKENFWTRFAYGNYFFSPGVDKYLNDTSQRLRTMPGAAKDAMTKDALVVIDVCCHPKIICDKASEIADAVTDKAKEIANDPDPLNATLETGKQCCTRIVVAIKDGVVESVNNMMSDDPEVSGDAIGRGFYQAGKTAVVAKGCEKAFEAVKDAFIKGQVVDDIITKTPPNGTNVTRNWGGQSFPNGKSWTRDSIPNQSRNSLGIESENTCEFVSHGKIVDNAGIKATNAKKWGRYNGGGDEVIVPDPLQQIRLNAITMPDNPIPKYLLRDPKP